MSDSSSQNKGQKRPRQEGEKKYIPGLKRRGTKTKQQCWKCMKPGHSHKECKLGVPEQKLSHLMCLGCREKGHNLKNCPKAAGGNSSTGAVKCFNCGDEGHASRNCPHDKIGDGASFAVCFVCKQEGHLSSRCPQNPTGRYPTGGACYHCQGKDHLARDCPNKDKPKVVAGGPKKPRSAPAGGDSLDDDYVAPDGEDAQTEGGPIKKKRKKNAPMEVGTKMWGGDQADQETESAGSSGGKAKTSQKGKPKTKVVKF